MSIVHKKLAVKICTLKTERERPHLRIFFCFPQTMGTKLEFQSFFLVKGGLLPESIFFIHFIRNLLMCVLTNVHCGRSFLPFPGSSFKPGYGLIH